MKTRLSVTLGAFALAALCSGAPSAADNEVIGVYKAWIAQSYTQGEETVCMMWSQPEKAEGDDSQRGDAYVFLSHRPGESRRDEIRFEAGYDFKGESSVEVTIDDQRFILTTNSSTAWMTSPTDEHAMVQAMRSGRQMLVKGTSSRGTDTHDTYSLYGFTAAHKAIDKACS